MKIQMLFSFLITSSFLFASEKNIVFVFDLDETLIEKRKDLDNFILSYIPEDLKDIYSAKLEVWKQNNFNVYDSGGNKARTGVLMAMLQVAQDFKNEDDYCGYERTVSARTKAFNLGKNYIEKMVSLVKALSEEHSLIVATNQDKKTFDAFENTDKGKELFSCFDHFILAHPGCSNSALLDLEESLKSSKLDDAEYRQFVEDFLNAAPRDNETFSVERKPSRDFFTILLGVVNNLYSNCRLIFIDNKKSNVDAAIEMGIESYQYEYGSENAFEILLSKLCDDGLISEDIFSMF